GRYIGGPNHPPGNTGASRRVAGSEPLPPLLARGDAPTGRIERFPAHPHEGAVRVPANEPRARVVAMGKSLTTGREFDLVVAFERSASCRGRAIAESSFHHFADYNWDIARGAPSFVSEPPGDGI